MNRIFILASIVLIVGGIVLVIVAIQIPGDQIILSAIGGYAVGIGLTIPLWGLLAKVAYKGDK